MIAPNSRARKRGKKRGEQEGEYGKYSLIIILRKITTYPDADSFENVSVY